MIRAVTAAAVACLLSGCGASLEPVQVAHVGAVSIAETNRIVTIACGEVAVRVAETDGKARGEALLARCQAAHDRVHESLVVAGAAIDAWRDGKAGAPACAVLDVQIAMLGAADNARGFGAKLPATVDDAIAFLGTVVVSQLGGCKR